MNKYFRIGAMAVPVLALILFVFFVLRPMVKFLTTSNEPEVDLSRLLPSDVNELESRIRASEPRREGIADGREGASVSRGGSALDLDSAVDLEQLGEIMAENSRLVKENPQQAALLIRYWINDGRL
jgi:flagellar biosynthesis/type III secretory pathway M-ring protein FliF/YscJ